MFRVAFDGKRVTMYVLDHLPQKSYLVKKELRKQIELLEQKMSKSPNNMKDGGSHFLYRRERMIRFKMLQKNMPQKMLAKRLNLTESYISKLITGERYNQDFERYITHILDISYCCL